MLWITADLEHALAELGEGYGKIGGGGAFANAPLSINGKHLRALDLKGRVLVHLQAALPIGLYRTYGNAVHGRTPQSIQCRLGRRSAIPVEPL